MRNPEQRTRLATREMRAGPPTNRAMLVPDIACYTYRDGDARYVMSLAAKDNSASHLIAPFIKRSSRTWSRSHTRNCAWRPALASEPSGSAPPTRFSRRPPAAPRSAWNRPIGPASGRCVCRRTGRPPLPGARRRGHHRLPRNVDDDIACPYALLSSAAGARTRFSLRQRCSASSPRSTIRFFAIRHE
jgi:hypothetical protein